ncbi:MAG: hypothetical protein R2749_24860 [Acidimicrobiales bacterium]
MAMMPSNTSTVAMIAAAPAEAHHLLLQQGWPLGHDGFTVLGLPPGLDRVHLDLRRIRCALHRLCRRWLALRYSGSAPASCARCAAGNRAGW